MKIWIDDVRTPPKEYQGCTSYKEAITTLKQAVILKQNIENISFDHDLGEEKSGYDIAKFIIEYKIPVNSFSIHSMNPVGTYNIRQLLIHYGYKEK